MAIWGHIANGRGVYLIFIWALPREGGGDWRNASIAIARAMYEAIDLVSTMAGFHGMTTVMAVTMAMGIGVAAINAMSVAMALAPAVAVDR